MSDHENIKKIYLEARKARDVVATGLLSVIITDIDERMRPGKGQVSNPDDATRAAVKAARKKHAQALEFGSNDKLVAEGLVLDSLPKPAEITQAEIIAVIEDLVDKNTSFKALMGATMKAFGGNADANTVRQLVSQYNT